jgi:hypothetical protein
MEVFTEALGYILCISLLGFVAVKVHRGTIQPAMAATLGVLGLVAPLLLSSAGSGWRAKLPGGATLETLTRKAQDAAAAASSDKQRVEELTAEIRQTADRLRSLESRYRSMIGDTASLTYVMWRVRGRFGSMPEAITGELDRLLNNLLTEAYPDESERSQVAARLNALTGGMP